MKLTNREKKLLLILAVAVLIMSYNKWILGPQRQEINELVEKKQQYQDTMGQMQKDISAYKKLDQDLKELNSKISLLTKQLYPTIFQEKIIMILDQQIKNSQLIAEAIKFTDLSVNNVDVQAPNDVQMESSLKQIVDIYQGATNIIKEKNIEPKEENKGEAAPPPRDIEQMSATIDYSGTYEMIIQFLREVEYADKVTPIRSLLMSKNQENNTLEGKIELEYYGVPKLKMEDEEYYRWDYINQYGKSNPFQ